MELPTVEWTNEELITGLRHIAHTMERNGHSYYQHVAEEAIKAIEQRWIPTSSATKCFEAVNLLKQRLEGEE